MTFSKNDQNWTFCPKSIVFNHFSVYFQQYKCLFIPLHSIYNYILGKLNFQKIVQYCFNFNTLLKTERCAAWTTLTHCQEKRDPCLLNNFASFFSNYMHVFQNFCYDFLTDFLQIWPMFWLFKGGSNWDPFLHIFLYKIHLLGRTILICEVQPPALGRGCRGTQIIPISSERNASL